MVQADDIPSLELVREGGGKCLGGDGDGHHAVRDPVEGKVGGQGDAADLLRKDIVSGKQVRGCIGPDDVLCLPGHAVRQVESSDLCQLHVIGGDEGATGHSIFMRAIPQVLLVLLVTAGMAIKAITAARTMLKMP